MSDRVVLVTGGARGIGLGIVNAFAEQGYRVMIGDLGAGAADWNYHLSDAADLQQALSQVAGAGEVDACELNVTDYQSCEAAVARTIERFGGLDILVNNAGVVDSGTIDEFSEESWDRIFAVNTKGIFLMSKAALAPLKASSAGAIVNTASIAGLVMGHHSTSYGVSKKAVVGLSEQLAVEFAREGHPIGVSVLCPSWVNTRINEGGRNRPSHLQNKASSIPPTPEMMKRWEELQRATAEATPPSVIADITFEGIKAEKLYILPHDESIAWVKQRFNTILKDIE